VLAELDRTLRLGPRKWFRNVDKISRLKPMVSNEGMVIKGFEQCWYFVLEVSLDWMLMESKRGEVKVRQKIRD